MRGDHGQSRALPREVSDLLLATKEENAELSVQLVIREALATGKVPESVVLAPSTVHRLLSRAGLMKRPKDAPGGKDHRPASTFEKGRRPLDERCHARTRRMGRRAQAQDLPHRLHRRRDPG
ncbi:MAG: hypothetical protein QM767_23440 [Anaeromyxobacter sp.]